MRAILDEMKNLTICDSQVTIRSTMNEKNVEEMNQLAEELWKNKEDEASDTEKSFPCSGRFYLFKKYL